MKEVDWMKKVDCFECACGFDLEYHTGYGWYHPSPFGGPDTECTNPDIINKPNPEDTEHNEVQP